jgi:ribosomal-protein-alanine N-acetyltransferase
VSHTLRFPDAIPELRDDAVSLRELTEDDVPAWFERASDPLSSALSGDPIPDSVETCFQWLQLHRDRFRERTGIRWAIVAEGARNSIGSIGLTVTTNEARTAEIGAVIARAHWGKGIGTAAARLVVRYAFDRLGLAEIRADLLQSNVASGRVLEKLGFQFAQTVAGDLQSGMGSGDRCLFVLQSESRTTV